MWKRGGGRGVGLHGRRQGHAEGGDEQRQACKTGGLQRKSGNVDAGCCKAQLQCAGKGGRERGRGGGGGLHGRTRGSCTIALKQEETVSRAGCRSRGAVISCACMCTTAAAAAIAALFPAKLSSPRAQRRTACTISRGVVKYAVLCAVESVSALGCADCAATLAGKL